MKLTKDSPIDHVKNADKNITKRIIGILFISLIVIVGVTLTSCAVVPTTQGKGMAAGVKGEIVLDVDGSKEADEDENREIETEKVEEKPETKSEEDEKDNVDSENSQGEDKVQRDDETLDAKDLDEDDAGTDKEDNSSDDLNEDVEVKSVYNSIVPPHMMPPSEALGDKKIVYLTFDDGPSKNITPQVLDILKEENVKATFFVIGNLAEENATIVERAAREGHTIANHSYSHDYKAIYASTDAFMAEIKQTDKVLSQILGDDYKAKYIRLPGGGFGSEYNAIKSTLIKDGYNYITWNAVTNDAVERNASPEKLFANFKETLNGNNYSVVLMHDGAAQKSTPKSLRLIIDYLKKEGYEFRTFDY